MGQSGTRLSRFAARSGWDGQSADQARNRVSSPSGCDDARQGDQGSGRWQEISFARAACGRLCAHCRSLLDGLCGHPELDCCLLWPS